MRSIVFNIGMTRAQAGAILEHLDSITPRVGLPWFGVAQPLVRGRKWEVLLLAPETRSETKSASNLVVNLTAAINSKRPNKKVRIA